MRKKIFMWGILIVVVCLRVIFFLSSAPDECIEDERKKTIKNLVNQMIRVQYRTHDEDVLGEIFTEELQNKLDIYYPGFYKEDGFYIITNNYMKTLDYVEESNEWWVILRVYDGLNPINAFYLHIGFIEVESGTYVISSLAIDI